MQDSNLGGTRAIEIYMYGTGQTFARHSTNHVSTLYSQYAKHFFIKILKHENLLKDS